MLIKFLKFLLGVFILFLFIILLFITFNNRSNNNVAFEIKQLSYSGNYKNIINNIDSIYTNNKQNFKVINNKNKENIIIGKGDFIFSMNDLSKKYVLNSTGFSIDLKIPGDVFISTNKANNVIMALNSVIEINFLDMNNKKINSIFLYPHEYFIFNPKFNSISFKGSDIYRLRILNQVKNKYKKPYIKQKLSNLVYNDVSNFISEEGYRILNNYILDKKDFLENNKINYSNILRTVTPDFPLRDFINENQKYFLNNTKKIIFFKNEIYNALIALFKQENFSKEEIDNIIKLKEKLKKLDINAYREIEDFNDNLYFILLFDNNLKNYSKLKNFLYLKEGRKNLDINGNFLNLKKIYINYDFDNGTKIIKYFKDFLEDYLQKSGIVEKKENFLINKKDKLDEVESFIFYLKKYIDAHLFINQKSNLKIENQILSKYFSLNKMIYFSGKQDINKIKTSFFENKKLLVKLEGFLRNNFFEKNRDKNDLLIIKDQAVNLEDILQLQKIINRIFDLTKDFKKNLNIEIVNEYDDLYKKLDEEFFALRDYDNYIIQKNKEINKLINTKGLGAKTTKTFTKEDIIQYLKKFRKLEFYENNIEKIDDKFEIKNVKIYDKEYNFILYPYLGNKLDIYDIKNNNTFSYDLDEQESLWEEKLKGAKKEDKYKYDFKNFFVYKFNDNYSKQTIGIDKEYCELQNMDFDYINMKCIDKNEDSSIIATFKQNKLLKEEFNIINDFFLVKYKDLDVKQNTNGEYKIKLNNVKTIIYIKDGNKNKKYELYINADYEFKEHIFKNISFKIMEDHKFLFDETNIQFSKFKQIKILDLKGFLETFLKENIKETLNIFNNLRNYIILYDLKIKVIFSNIMMSFNNGNKNIQIKFEKNKINFIVVEGKNILTNSIHIEDLQNYIDKLK